MTVRGDGIPVMQRRARTPKRRAYGDPNVAAIFAAYPPAIRARLRFLRGLIYDVADRTPGVGAINETVRWGQPSYLTTQSKSGSLIRIDRVASHDETYAMYFHCQTTLVDTFRERFPDRFEYGGNRSILFRVNEPVPVEALRECIALALTYRRDKNLRSAPARTKARRSRKR